MNSSMCKRKSYGSIYFLEANWWADLLPIIKHLALERFIKPKITFSTPVKSLSKSSKELIEMPDFLCQFMPYSDAAMLDAAVVLAEYIEKLCSVKRKRECIVKVILLLSFCN